MSAKQELRTFFKGSLLSFIYKVPLLLLVTVVYTVYSVMKLSIKQLPIAVHYIFNYVVKFYDNILIHIPFYVNDYFLLNIHYLLIKMKNTVITTCQQFYQSILRPIAHVCYTVVIVKLPQLIEDAVKPCYLFIVMYIIPYISQRMRKFLAMLKHYCIMLCVLLIQLSKWLLDKMIVTFYYMLRFLFLILVILARNLIYAYHVAKSIYLQYLLLWLTHLATSIWRMFTHINKMVLSLADILQRFNRFCFDTIIQPLGHLIAILPSLIVNMIAELRLHVDNAMHVVRQFMDQVFHHIT